MFTIGEFSRIAQVSRRLLRYYDEIGLFSPAHTDHFTNFRYYSAEQMPHLNRILALRDLGFSLEQIQQIVRENISNEEIHGMFLLKKAEIEQQIQGELHRLRRIESRLQTLGNTEENKPLNVVLKHSPAQPVLSVRTIVETFETGLDLFNSIARVLPEKSGYDFRFCICYGDSFVERDLDLEMGYLLQANSHAPVPLSGDLHLRFRELEACATLATFVVKGALESIHTGYSQIGFWVEANGYRLAGTPREITLQAPQAADGSDLITEIQFPVESLQHS